MNTLSIQLLFDYDDWANNRILDTAASLTDEEYAAATFANGASLHNTLAHIHEAQQVWRLRCQHGISPSVLVAGENISSLAALREIWKSERAAMRWYLASLSDADLAGTITYTNTKGQSFENTLWQILAHVINHGTQHRSEAAMLLTDLGYSPRDLDLILFLRLEQHN